MAVQRTMVLPNLIWKPGRVASKLRKAACVVLQVCLPMIPLN